MVQDTPGRPQQPFDHLRMPTLAVAKPHRAVPAAVPRPGQHQAGAPPRPRTDVRRQQFATDEVTTGTNPRKEGTVVKRSIAVTVLALAALLGLAGPAAAHNTLVNSDPAEGAQLSTAPTEIRLTFDQPAQPDFNTVTITGPDGEDWATGPLRVEGNSVIAPLRELGPAGEYTVAYRVLSADGHPVSGKFTFTLTQPGPGAAEPPAQHQHGDGSAADPAQRAPEETADSSGMPVWPWIAGALVLLALAAVLVLRLGKSNK